MRALAHLALSVGLLLACASVQAQQAPASPGDTDPVKMVKMKGRPQALPAYQAIDEALIRKR